MYVLPMVNAVEPFFSEQLVKVSQDLIQKPHALNTLVVHIKFLIILWESWDRGKHDSETQCSFAYETFETVFVSSGASFVMAKWHSNRSVFRKSASFLDAYCIPTAITTYLIHQ